VRISVRFDADVHPAKHNHRYLGFSEHWEYPMSEVPVGWRAVGIASVDRNQCLLLRLIQPHGAPVHVAGVG
jgi:hypothetical protein